MSAVVACVFNVQRDGICVVKGSRSPRGRKGRLQVVTLLRGNCTSPGEGKAPTDKYHEVHMPTVLRHRPLSGPLSPPKEYLLSNVSTGV